MHQIINSFFDFLNQIFYLNKYSSYFNRIVLITIEQFQVFNFRNGKYFSVLQIFLVHLHQDQIEQ